jgi:outer membrane protein OmpA-like peptidoglycan-associated protein
VRYLEPFDMKTHLVSFSTQRLLLAAVACAVAMIKPAMAQSGNFGSETPSVNQIIDQLKVDGGDDATAGVRTRALRPGAASQATAMPEASAPAAPAAPAAISMQVQFAFGSDQIAEPSRKSIDNLASALSSDELKGRTFTVAGHTDGVGSADYNLRLSQRRAASVKSYLVEHGVAAARLKAIGKGMSELLNANDPRAAENRRVEIIASGS